jgi:hypothetical protein
VIAISAFVGRRWSGLMSDDRVSTIWNGFDVERIGAVSPTADWPGPGSAFRPILVADLVRWKGHSLYLAALASLQGERFGPVSAVLVGRPRGAEGAAYLSELRAGAHALGLTGSVRFVTDASDALPWIAAADVVVSAAEGEPFGRTVVEGLALGKPVVAVRGGGPDEILGPCSAGTLVDADAGAIAAGLRRWLCRQERQAAAPAALARARDFGLATAAARVSALYRACLLPLRQGGLVACLCALLWLGTGCVTRRAAGPAPGQAEEVLPEPAVPQFEDWTERAGLAGVNARTVNWLDADADGRPDLLVNGARLFRNLGGDAPTFAEITTAAGLGSAGSGPAVCLDLDNDGDTDIVSTRGYLWRNDGRGHFADIAREAGFAPHPKANVIGCGDVDGDGFADLYIGMKEDWNDGRPAYYPHQLWLNRGGAQLAEVGASAGIDRSTYARTVLFADVDGDGRQDIFVGNYRLQANLLWCNRGDVRFADRAERFGVRGRLQPEAFYDPFTRRSYGPRYGHTIGACWLDFDNDGRIDLFTANLVHKYVGPGSRKTMAYDIRGYVCDDSAIYRRTEHGFEDWRDALRVSRKPIGGPGGYQGDELWAGCIPADVNNDGWEDVFVPQIYNLSYARSLLLLNAFGRAFSDGAAAAGVSRIDTYAGAFADVDGDGWVDLATGGRSAKDAPGALCLYRNRGCGAGSAAGWLRIAVRSGSSGRSVLGAVVEVVTDSLRQTRLVTAGSSTYSQQNEGVLHFGLGDWHGRVAVRVTWPDGAVEELPAAPGDSLCLRWNAPAARAASLPAE